MPKPEDLKVLNSVSVAAIGILFMPLSLISLVSVPDSSNNFGSFTRIVNDKLFDF